MFHRAAAALLALAAMASAEKPVARALGGVSCPDYDIKLTLSKTKVKAGQKVKATCTIKYNEFGCEDAWFGFYNDGLDFYKPKIAPTIKGSSNKYSYDDSEEDFTYWVFPTDNADIYTAAKKGYKATITYQIPKDAESEDSYDIYCSVVYPGEGGLEYCEYQYEEITVA